MKIKMKWFVGISTVATLLGSPVSVEALDLFERYPTKLTAGDAVPENARAWEFDSADVFRLSRFNLAVGKDLKIEIGAADVGIAHCTDGAVWAVIIPSDGGKLISPVAKEETIAHVWLRFHPKEIGRVFPAETVLSDGATNLMRQMREVAAVKFRSSWHAGMRAMIPEPKDMTVDVDTKAGLRRFFMVDTAVPKTEYVAAFEQQSLHPSQSQSEIRISLDSAPPVVVKTFPVAGSTDVDPALTEIRVTYSKAMQDGSWSWSTWGEENYPETTGKPKYLSDNRTCVLPVKLQPRKFYAIWLNSDKFKNFKDVDRRSAVPYLLTFRTGEAAGASAAVIERTVDKLVSEFPDAFDLSTPESACAAWQRANARKDAQAISQLSLVPLDPKEEENWFRREEKRDAEGLAIYLKAIADSKIVVVQLWRGELANVITCLPFPEGKGRAPYSTRNFGLVNGAWKNLGEDRSPDLETAKANFEKKKEKLWQHFIELKAKVVPAVTPVKQSAAADMSLALLNDDQRSVLAWIDRQFRSFFDARTFDGWSNEERVNLEKRLIDSLDGPQTREYYQAINTLAALRSGNALPKLREIAFDRADKDCRDRWMAIRALGIIGDKTSVPELIHLVYHGNVNTRWWAQISLVRLTGRNFAKDWNAWGSWWNDQNGQPPFKPEIIRWWNGQAEPDKLVGTLAENDKKFFDDINPKVSTSKNLQQN
jgi:hypothetical protein